MGGVERASGSAALPVIDMGPLMRHETEGAGGAADVMVPGATSATAVTTAAATTAAATTKASATATTKASAAATT